MAQIMQLVFSGGERYPILVDSTGLPDFWVTLFVTEKLRVSLKQTAIENTIRNIIHLKLWEEINERNLISEISQSEFPSDADIASIRDHCLLHSRSIKEWHQATTNRKVLKFSASHSVTTPHIQAISKDHAANRLVHIANYLHFTARAMLRQRPDFISLSPAIDEMKKRIIAQKPKGSILTLLMFAPSRAGELPGLVVDCLHETENGRLGVRWYGEKGFGDTIKWVPDVMRETVVEAHRRLVEIGALAREAAKFAYDNPGVFFRHAECITPSDFPEDRPLSALEFAHAMNFGQATLDALKDRSNEAAAWQSLSLGKWIKKLRSHGNPTYQQLAQYTQNEYEHKEWPLIPNSDRPVWESLLLVRDREFHNDFKPRGFSWLTPSVNQINWQLAPRDGLKNPTKTLFQRFGILDEDSSEIRLTSHQLRVWLSTNAERGGMDSWQLAKWAGRARIQDNRHYDLRTPEEREEQVRAVMCLTERPAALEAIKLNLPVSYQDLGLNRIGIADVTEYGMCTHDYAMSPCTKGGECMTCKEHVCIKAMPRTLKRIQRLEELVASQFEKAKLDAESGVFGADRWETHLGWKLAHIRTQRTRLESDETPEGAVLWIPPEHDPSPIRRALEQRNYKTSPEENRLVDGSTAAVLLGMNNA